MKKIYILNHEGINKIFFNFNNLKKYLKEKVFVKIGLSKKEITNEISSIHLEKANSGDFRQFYYSFKNIKIYNLGEHGIIK